MNPLTKLYKITFELEKYHMKNYQETIKLCDSFYVKTYNTKRGTLYGIIRRPKDKNRRHDMCIQGFWSMDELDEWSKKNNIEVK